jgi:6-phosphogluconolactonase
MIRESFLARAPAPSDNIHAVPTEGLNADDAAMAYQEELIRFYGAATLDPARPLLDVNLLGLGPDGHTASLFPGTAALDERDRWVVAVSGAKEEDRITLTYKALNSSRRAAFLVEGAGKREMLRRLLAGDETIPAGCIAPVGELIVFADAAAAG